MFVDERSEFAHGVALNTGAPGSYVIGDQIDTGAAGNLAVNGLRLVLKVGDTGINAAGAGTLAFQLVSADNGPLTENPEVHAQFGAVVTSATSGNPGGALEEGRLLAAMELPAAAPTSFKRYLGLRQVTGGQAIATGSIDAFLTSDPAAWRTYADNFN